MVHRLRAGGGAAHRSRGAGRECRLRLDERSAGRAQGARCLSARAGRKTEATDARGRGAEPADTCGARRWHREPGETAGMIYEEVTSGSRTRRTISGAARVLFELRIDGPLVVGLSLIAAYGLVVLYSVSVQSMPAVLPTVSRFFPGSIGL